MQANVVADLLEGPRIDEGRDAVDPGPQARVGQTGGNRACVGMGSLSLGRGRFPVCPSGAHLILIGAGLGVQGIHLVGETLGAGAGLIATGQGHIVG